MTFTADLSAFSAANPGIETAEIFMVDLNARVRGKIVPVGALQKLAKGGMRMPTSSPGLDFFSDDVPGTGLAIETGDPDGPITPVPGTLVPLLWTDPVCAQVMVTIAKPDGGTAPFDGRNVLAAVEARAQATGFTPVMALEQEFFLVDPKLPQPPVNPQTGQRLRGGQVYDLDVARAFQPVLSGMTAAIAAMGAEATTVLTEYGGGQFEINLGHVPSALQAADQVMMLRRAVRGVARAHGLDATFMAKPWDGPVGSGLHLHLSLLDAAGANVFSGDGSGPNPAMAGAIAGMVDHMADSTLIFAPHLNSYRRMIPSSMAPIEANWAVDNRGASVRIPELTGTGARIEHRVAAADANPYLVAAAVLAAALDGMQRGATPPAPLMGEIRSGQAPPLPQDWLAAIDLFAGSDFVADKLGQDLRHVFATVKRQERFVLLSRITDVEQDLYLRKS